MMMLDVVAFIRFTNRAGQGFKKKFLSLTLSNAYWHLYLLNIFVERYSSFKYNFIYEMYSIGGLARL